VRELSHTSYIERKLNHAGVNSGNPWWNEQFLKGEEQYSIKNVGSTYFYIVISPELVQQQKRTRVEKITKIILILMKIVEGMHKKTKTLKQHDDRTLVIYLKKLFIFFYFMFYTNIEVPSFFKICVPVPMW